MGIEIVHCAGLAEMLDAERDRAVTKDASEPDKRCRMPVYGDDEANAIGYFTQQGFDTTSGFVITTRPRSLLHASRH